MVSLRRAQRSESCFPAASIGSVDAIEPMFGALADDGWAISMDHLWAATNTNLYRVFVSEGPQYVQMKYLSIVRSDGDGRKLSMHSAAAH